MKRVPLSRIHCIGCACDDCRTAFRLQPSISPEWKAARLGLELGVILSAILLAIHFAPAIAGFLSGVFK